MQQIGLQNDTSPHPLRILSIFAPLDQNLHLCSTMEQTAPTLGSYSSMAGKDMSKRSLFWGSASGKLGETVQYRAGGEQRARAYVAKIKNPKTVAQMRQRIPMLNANVIFKSISSIIRESFPNKKSNQSGWNAFVQANKDVKKSAVDKASSAALGCAPFGYIVANGSLPYNMALGARSVEGQTVDGTQFYANGLNGLLNMTAEGSTPPKMDTIFADNAAIYQYLRGNGNPLNLPTSFKITFVWGNYGDITESFEVWSLNVAQYEAVDADNQTFRMISNPSGKAALPVITVSQSNAMNGEVLSEGLGFIISDSYNSADDSLGAMIISYSDANGIQCTRSIIGNDEIDMEFVNQFRQGGDVWEQVMEEYGTASSEFLGTKE